jgi:hypothetical protein
MADKVPPTTEVIPEPIPEPIPDPRDAHIEKLNRENAERRISEKKLKESNQGHEAVLKEIMGAFGAETPEDLTTRLSEYRAAQSEKTNPENDPKVLRANLARLDEAAKKSAAEATSFKQKYETVSTKYTDRTIGKAIGDAIAAFSVKPAFIPALTGELKKNVKLNDNDEVVWVQKDKTGNDQYETDVKEGIGAYWLPSTVPAGSGTPQATKAPPPGRTNIKDLSLSDYKQKRKVLTGLPDPQKARVITTG